MGWCRTVHVVIPSGVEGGNAIIGTACPETSGRDDGEWERIAKFIQDNPMNWDRDRFRAMDR